MSAVMEQRTPEWLAARAGKITGSRIGTILGLNPYQTKEQLIRAMVREIKGAESEFVMNHHVQRGIDNEASSLMTLSLETGINFRECGFVPHPDYDWIGVSPDAIADDCGAEIKNPVKPQPLASKPQYEAQIRLCMECCGVDKWYYFSDPVEGERIIELVDRREMWLSGVLPALQDFMDLLDKEVDNPAHLEPLVEDRTDTEFLTAARVYLEAKRAATAATQAETEAKKALTELADKKSCRGGGVAVTWAQRKGSVNNKKIYEDFGIDVEKYRGKPTNYYTVNEVKQ